MFLCLCDSERPLYSQKTKNSRTIILQKKNNLAGADTRPWIDQIQPHRDPDARVRPTHARHPSSPRPHFFLSCVGGQACNQKQTPHTPRRASHLARSPRKSLGFESADLPPGRHGRLLVHGLLLLRRAHHEGAPDGHHHRRRLLRWRRHPRRRLQDQHRYAPLTPDPRLARVVFPSMWRLGSGWRCGVVA